MAVKICILQILALISFFLPVTYSIEFNFPAVFNFGDSNSDTGNLIAAGIESLDPPHGQSYFKKPSGRYCDGRLVIDFLMEAMKLPFLNAYLDSIGMPSFQKGCNYAAAGSTVHPASPSSVSPFSFDIQINQFLHFKARVLELLAKSKRLAKYLPAEDYFSKGLYMFDIGQNDLAGAFYSKTLDQVLALVPQTLAEFEQGFKRLYDQGARNFWIHNTGPLGCLTQNVAKFGTDPSKLDELGCVSGHNQAAKIFNLQLQALCKKLTFCFAGFEQPIMACCGVGGAPLNGKYSDPPFADKMPFLLDLKF